VLVVSPVLPLWLSYGIMIAVLLLFWLAGWNTINQYGQEALVWAGFLAIGFGLLTIKGHWDTTRSFNYQHSLSVTDQDGWERTKWTVVESMNTRRFLLILMVTVGCISILLGSLVQTISL
jgi:hypothetical protein